MPTNTPTTPVKPVLPSALDDGPLPREAWESLAAERAALPESGLITVNLDVQSAAIIALGAYDEIVALRERAVATLVGFDPSCIDKLPLYASAAYHAQTLHQGADADQKQLPALDEEASKLRDLLNTDLAPFVKRGLVDRSKLKEYRGAVGYRVVAADLAILVNAFRSLPADALAKSSTSEAELLHAERLGQRITVAIGRREQQPAVVSAIALDRQRALTLFMDAYDEVRRAVSFLRWREGDAERIAPTLYGTRERKKKDEPATDAPTPPPTTTTPATIPSADRDDGLSPFAS